MKKAAAILLAMAMLLALCACGTASSDPRRKYGVEENKGGNRDSYPYLVRTESATWYLSGSDIELLGKEAMLDGLYDVLQDQEADFADARAALAGFIWKNVEPVDIYTDFSGKANASQMSGAYYNPQSNFIKVFHGWDLTKFTLMHEYVHYLTFHCTDTPVSRGLFAEGIAEYVSKIACKSRMVRSWYSGLSEEEESFVRSKGAWDEEENCVDPMRYWFGMAEVYAKGLYVGEEFFSTSDITIVRTPEIQQNPDPWTISHFEAACIVAYLIETYSRQTVLSHMDVDPAELEQVYAEPFSDLYAHWFAWNTARSGELGLIT